MKAVMLGDTQRRIAARRGRIMKVVNRKRNLQAQSIMTSLNSNNKVRIIRLGQIGQNPLGHKWVKPRSLLRLVR